MDQIAGPIYSNGVWNKRERLPSLIAGSKYLGCVPSYLGPIDKIDWVPNDQVSQIAVELLTTNRGPATPTTQVFHLVNPSGTYWPELVPVVLEWLGIEVRAVSLAEWVQKPRESLFCMENVDRNPAAKLVDLFGARFCSNSSPIMETRAAVERNLTLRRLERLTGEMMKKWLEGWGFEVAARFIDSNPD